MVEAAGEDKQPLPSEFESGTLEHPAGIIPNFNLDHSSFCFAVLARLHPSGSSGVLS